MTHSPSGRSVALIHSVDSLPKRRGLRGLGLSVVLVAALACSSKTPEGSPTQIGSAGSTSAAGGGGGVVGAGMGGALLSTGGTMPTLPIAGTPGTSQGGSGSSGGTSSPPKMVTQECATSQTSSKDLTAIQPADIIFAIDTSSSMTAEIEFVQSYMNEFSQMIVSSGIDVRVILIAAPRDRVTTGGGGAGGVAGVGGAPSVAGAAGAATGGRRGGGVTPGQGSLTQTVCIGPPLGSGQCPDDTKLPNYFHVQQYVDSNNALDVILNTYPQYKEHLRPNASKSFVVISDDNATDLPTNSAAAFTSAVNALDPTLFAKWTFNGVYCFTACPVAAAVGSVFKDLVTQTQGVGGDLCEQDFQPVFKRLAEQIITNSGSEIACEWEFPPPPEGKSFSTELVEVQRTGAAGVVKLPRTKSMNECAAGGWYYDDPVNPKKILACPSTCADMQNDAGGKIDVIFGCEQFGGCAAASVSVMSETGATMLTCDWALPTPPEGTQLDFANVNVRFTNESGFSTTLGKVNTNTDCAMFDLGWHYDDAKKPTRIVACPETCSKLQQGGSKSKVDVLLGCESIPAPPK